MSIVWSEEILKLVTTVDLEKEHQSFKGGIVPISIPLGGGNGISDTDIHVPLAKFQKEHSLKGLPVHNFGHIRLHRMALEKDTIDYGDREIDCFDIEPQTIVGSFTMTKELSEWLVSMGCTKLTFNVDVIGSWEGHCSIMGTRILNCKEINAINIVGLAFDDEVCSLIHDTHQLNKLTTNFAYSAEDNILYVRSNGGWTMAVALVD